MTNTTTEIAPHGTFVHAPDLLSAAMERTRASLYAEVVEALEGSGIKGLSKLRKFELAAMVADFATGQRENDEAYAELTATQKLARLQAETPRHECGLSRQGIDCMCADAAELDVDTEDLDDVETEEPVAFRTVLLYDRIECQAMHVLGSGIQCPGTVAVGVFYRFENDAPDREPRWAWSGSLRHDQDRYVALCRHYYGVMDSCPNCDAAEDTEAQLQELIRQANAATPDPVDTRIDSITPGWSEDARDFVARSVRYPSPEELDAIRCQVTAPRPPGRPITLAEYLTKTGTTLLRSDARAARC